MDDRYAVVRGELSLLENELRLLPERRIAYENLENRTQIDMVRRFCMITRQAEEVGTPLSDGLRMLAQDSRKERFLDAERRASRLPVLIQLPVVLFIFPPLFIFIIGPAGIRLFNTFSGG